MPELKEYVNREGITPTDRGTEARVQEGRRVGAFFNQRAESLRDFGNRTAQEIGGAIRDAGNAAVQYQEHRQLNQGIDTYWPIRGGLEDDWNDTVKGNPDKGIPPADPHDPAIAQRFMEEKVKPTLQKWGDTFTTEGAQNWARGRIDSLTGHFQEKTAADMGTVAKQQIDTSLRTMANTASNSAYNDPSPSNVRHIVEDLKASLDGMVGSSPHLRGAEAARASNELGEKYTEQVVKAGMMGDIRKSPDPEKTAGERIKDPLYSKYISGAEADQVAKAATSQRKVNEYHDRSVEAMRRAEGRDKVDAAIAENIAKNVKIDRATAKAAINPQFFDDVTDMVVRNADAPNAAATYRTYVDWAQMQLRERKENPVSDRNTMGKLYKGLSDPDNPTTIVQILDAETTGKLSRYDTQNLSNLHKAIEDQQLNSPVFKATMKAVEEAVGLGVVNDGHERYANFMQRFIPEYQKLERSGASTAGALNLRDPNSLLSKLLDEYKPDPNTLFSARLTKKMGFGGVGVENLQNAIPGAKSAPPLPVPANREINKVYDTPVLGKMKWTGTGWVKP